MNKIARTKRACHNGRDPTTVGCLYADIIADVNEYLLVTQGNEGKLAKVGVRRKIFESVKLGIVYNYLGLKCEEGERKRTACPRSLNASYSSCF